ncbi:MAG: hypothetical protein A3K19_14830 [Lentisphaerae bacterium RIFOXYB12_FULL_65_16]|nr:MAG: hypothetical protein A3K18_27390 [Lentisphaerae bacterium RIFOXYA12_64_32]OGV85899.1 MAG: hypothetical protein A3K19_14830 [Lentisphaerae bacterium RIFOXYB12_FULL_65_16]
MRPIHAWLCLVALHPLLALADAPVNLALAEHGGMATAQATAPNLQFSAAKVCDGKPTTAWVSASGSYPVWLRIEWRVPVTVEELVVRQGPVTAQPGVGVIGQYAIEGLVGNDWTELAGGDASGLAPDAAIQHRLPDPLTTTAVRLLVRSSAAAQVAVTEFEVLGPAPVFPADWAPKWQAQWIWAEPSLLIPHREPNTVYFRRCFTVDDPAEIAQAWLLGCAFDRLNNLWLNNRPAVSHISYYGGSLRQAQVFEVPPDWFLKGENVLAAAVDDIYEVGSHGLLAELVLVRKNGQRETIFTDSTWRGQTDQGRVPDWRQPGFQERNWTDCAVRARPNGHWHWLWNLARPMVAPEDRLTLTELRVAPQPVKPGGKVSLALTFETAGPVSRDYAVVLRLGSTPGWTNQDLDVWGAFLAPDTVRSSTWQPGRNQVSIDVHVPDYAPAQLPATLLVSTRDAGAGLDSTLPGTHGDAYGLHFTIAVDRGNTPPPPATVDFPRCDVRDLAGTPTLHIDGKPVPPIIWTSWYGNCRRVSDYAATGVKLFRIVMQGSPVPAPGEEEACFAAWFEQVDRVMSTAVSIDPDVRVIAALNMDPEPQWLFDNPSEQMIGGRGSAVIPLSLEYPDRGQVRPTFMSQAWRRDGSEGLAKLVRHMRSQPYAPNVIGLCFFAGRAGENYWGINERNLFLNEQGQYDAKPRETWEAGDFSTAARRTFREFLMRKYGTAAALQQAWQQPEVRFDDILEPARFRRQQVCDVLTWVGKPAQAGSLRNPLEPGVGMLPMDYNQCFSEAMIDTFATWGKAVKDASDGRLITGCFYGYALAQLFTSVPGFHGHTAVAQACRTPYLDYYVSPSEYDGDRMAGGHYWGHNIVDSLRLHGKLWLFEQDTRTYLAEALPKTYSCRDTIEVMKREAAAALTRGSAWWWYEFATGQNGTAAREWFADPDIAEFATQIRKIYEFSLTLPDRGPSSQIAVFYHGETLTAQDLFAPTLPLNITIGRLTLVNGMQRMGAPFDLYNLADIAELSTRGMLNQYRLCIFLNPFCITPAEHELLDLCKGGNRTLLWLYAPGLVHTDTGLSVERVQEFTAMRGVRSLDRKAPMVYRLAPVEHPILAGMAPGQEFAALPFPPGATWERFGNEVWPLFYVDTSQPGTDTLALASWVLDGQPRPDMAALCVRRVTGDAAGDWNSVYAAIPYLTPDLLRGMAKFAGVHAYIDSTDVLFADRHFLAIHTGKDGMAGPVRLPSRTSVYDVFAGKPVADSAESVTVRIEPFATALYYLGDPQPFATAMRRDREP